MVTSLRSMLVTQDFEYRLTCLKERTSNFLRFWQAHSPHYTDHGELHCESVESNLDELIPDEIKHEMNEYEIFLLLSGVQLHDVGVMCAASSSESDSDIRKNHHERSKQFVVEKLKDLLDAPERFVIGEICLAHRDSVPIESIERSKTVRHRTLGNKEIRVQFLAAVLRLADSCDLCHTRTSEMATSITNPNDEASFYHHLHERVSGIKFGSKEHVIVVDLNIMSHKEEPICQRYLIGPLQDSLNSVRDCLTRHSITYIDVTAKFSVTNTITTELSVPKKTSENAPRRRTTEVDKARSRIWSLVSHGEYEKGLTMVEEILKRYPNDPFLWRQKRIICSELKDNTREKEAIDNCLRLNPNDPTFLADAGHFYGEILLDAQKSFEFLEKAYRLQPRDRSSPLNYAEALVTVGRFQDAYDLATKDWKRNNDLMMVFNAQLIRATAALFMKKRKLGLKELQNALLFFKSSPPTLQRKNSWVYNKISKYVRESSLDEDVKKGLASLLGLAQSKISIKQCEKELGRLK